jgi:prepilin-type N-terminal cleavage/methylation domain-containing protein
MIWAFKTNRGFTLVELLVVIAIMMLALTLVAPFGVNMVTKARAQVEWVELQNLVKSASARAFLNAQSVNLVLSGSEVAVGLDPESPVQIEFEYLEFDQTYSVWFSRNGVPSLDMLTVNVGEQVRELQLNTMIAPTAGAQQ